MTGNGDNIMPRGGTISKSGRIWVVKKNNREVGYAQNKHICKKEGSQMSNKRRTGQRKNNPQHHPKILGGRTCSRNVRKMKHPHSARMRLHAEKGY